VGRVSWSGAAALWLCALASGCGAGDAPRWQTVHAVTGKVVLANGKPLNGGAVYFVPADGAVMSEGKIAPDGSFSLLTGGSGAGAPAGEFKVRIEPPDASVLAIRRTPGSGKGLPFPARYLDEDTSGLTVVVKSGANDLKPFVLK
jgi:hypothetical protein